MNPIVPPSVPPMLPPGRRERRFALPALLAVLVIGGGFIYWKTSMQPARPVPSAGQAAPVSDVVVTNAMSASSTAKSLPDGFPADIPIDRDALVESYKAVYASRGATQYTASYTSSKSKADLSAAYSAYMKTAGFEADVSGQTGGMLSGTKGNDSLMVVISTQAGKSLVQISYLARS